MFSESGSGMFYPGLGMFIPVPGSRIRLFLSQTKNEKTRYLYPGSRIRIKYNPNKRKIKLSGVMNNTM
jgi:hypothetical protein